MWVKQKKQKKHTHTFWLHNILSLVQIHHFKNTNKYNTIQEWQKVKWKTKRQRKNQKQIQEKKT